VAYHSASSANIVEYLQRGAKCPSSNQQAGARDQEIAGSRWAYGTADDEPLAHSRQSSRKKKVNAAAGSSAAVHAMSVYGRVPCICRYLSTNKAGARVAKEGVLGFSRRSGFDLGRRTGALPRSRRARRRR
jgi:hypothetical protein